MRFHFPYMLTLFSLVFAVSYGTQNSAELYWKSVLPNTPMPKVVTDLLQSGTSSRVSTRKVGQGGVSVNGNRNYAASATDQLLDNHKVGQGGVSVKGNCNYAASATGQLHDNHKVGQGGVSVNGNRNYAASATGQLYDNHKVGQGGVSVNGNRNYAASATDQLHGNHKVGQGGVSVKGNRNYAASATDQLHDDHKVGQGGVSVNGNRNYAASATDQLHDNHKVGQGGVSVNGNRNYAASATDQLHENHKVGQGGVSVNGNRNYAASATQLPDNGDVVLYFVEKEIQPGTKMILNFIKPSNKETFLPRQKAQSIPFSSKKLPEILNKLSLKSQSAEAEMVKETIKECENPSMKGEEKYCATSLESMIDFATSKIGKHVEAVSTEVARESGIQKYTITQVEKKRNPVVCHKQIYPFAVFYCHLIQATEAYVVTLEGVDGTKAKAVAACHRDTSGWNPKHLAFQMLKVKPGTVSVCHFLLEDDIAWIQN